MGSADSDGDSVDRVLLDPNLQLVHGISFLWVIIRLVIFAMAAKHDTFEWADDRFV